MEATDAGSGESNPQSTAESCVKVEKKDEKKAAISGSSANATSGGGREGGGEGGGGGLKSPGKSPLKSVKRHGQEESDEEGEVKDSGTPIGNRDLRLEIGMFLKDALTAQNTVPHKRYEIQYTKYLYYTKRMKYMGCQNRDLRLRLVSKIF